METTNVILYGASGHCKVIFEILEAISITPTMIWDDAPKPDLFGLEVIKPFPAVMNRPVDMIISIGDNRIRKMIAERNYGSVNYINARHPSSTVSKTASVGEGTVVMAGAAINADAAIGKHCIINTSAVVEHECVIGDYVHLSPNVTLCGNVTVGEGTHMGAGSIAIPGVKIGSWCTVGAGAVLIRDVPNGSTVVGNPGRIIKTL